MISKREHEETMMLEGFSRAQANHKIYSSYSEFDVLIDVCCRAFGISQYQLVGKRRVREFVLARQAFCFFAYNFLIIGKSDKSIGGAINRERSNVTTARVRFSEGIDQDPELAMKALDILHEYKDIVKWQR